MSEGFTDPYAPPSPEAALARLQEFAASGPIMVPRTGGGDANRSKERLTRLVIDTEFATKCCVTGLSTILWRAEQGDLRAAIYLCDRFMGAPTQSVTVRAASMSADEVREQLYQEYRRQGFSDGVAKALVDATEREMDGRVEQMVASELGT